MLPLLELRHSPIGLLISQILIEVIEKHIHLQAVGFMKHDFTFHFLTTVRNGCKGERKSYVSFSRRDICGHAPLKDGRERNYRLQG